LDLRPLLAPRSIAIVGASESPDSWAPEIYRSLLHLGFEGELYPINPKYDEVWGRPCGSSVLELPRGVDLAVFVGVTIPAMFVLQAIAGLALGWELHVRLAERPLGEALRPFREFRIGDVWIWALVLAAGGWLLGHDALAQNLAVVLGAFYFLQGAAIVVSFAAAAGISTTALVVGAAVAAALAVPLAFIVPGMWTLGVTDTWFEYRRRLAARAGSTGA
jgi:hypothetical protein